MKKVKLGEVTINIDNRRKPLNNLQRIEKSLTKKYPYCGANNIIDYIDEYIFDENEEILCIAEDGGSWGKDEECTYVMNEKCWVNNHAHVLKMKSGVDINYIKLSLDYIDLSSYITGSTRGKLTKSSLEKIEIKLPDYHTQISISKKISDIQNLITKKKVQVQKYNELVKSRFNEMFIQRDFPLKRLGELVEEVRYGTSLPATLNGKYGYLRMNNITEDGQLNIQNLKHIDVPEKDLEKYVVRNGDVLFNRTNSIELVGKTCIYELDFDMVIAGYIIRIRTKKDILNPRYLSEFLNFPSTKEFLRNIAKGAVNQANINAKELQDIAIPLPPLSLQNEFAEFVAQVDKSQFACQMAIKLWRNSLKSSII